MIVVGIDPGTVTGFAIWSTELRALQRVESMPIHRAMDEVRVARPGFADGGERPRTVLVIFEDARSMRLGGGETYGQNARLQGVGSVKRDSAIWEDFLEDLGIPYQAKKWCAGTTKWDAARFRRDTGWTGQTNEHARDAAVIVFGLNGPIAGGIVQAWEQRSSNAIRSSSRKGLPTAGMRARRSSTAAGA